jgi:hypothetical protein
MCSSGRVVLYSTTMPDQSLVFRIDNYGHRVDIQDCWYNMSLRCDVILAEYDPSDQSNSTHRDEVVMTGELETTDG